MAQVFDAYCIRDFLGEVRDADRLIQAMRSVDFLIHTAGLKRVPAAENNPMECVKTNIRGAKNVIRAALENEVDKVIALSTEKAASPIKWTCLASVDSFRFGRFAFLGVFALVLDR